MGSRCFLLQHSHVRRRQRKESSADRCPRPPHKGKGGWRVCPVIPSWDPPTWLRPSASRWRRGGGRTEASPAACPRRGRSERVPPSIPVALPPPLITSGPGRASNYWVAVPTGVGPDRPGSEIDELPGRTAAQCGGTYYIFLPGRTIPSPPIIKDCSGDSVPG